MSNILTDKSNRPEMAEAALQHRIAELRSKPDCAPAAQDLISFDSSMRDSGKPLSIQIIRELDGLDEIKADWTALYKDHGHSHQVFQTYTWVRLWCDHFLTPSNGNSNVTLHILTVRRDGALVMVVPLARICSHGQCRIEWLGTPVSQYGDVLVADIPEAEDIVSAGFDFLFREAGSDIIILRKVRADSVAARILQEKNPTITSGDVAPAVTLPSQTSFDVFQERYNAKARKNRRRHRRRLMEQGDITFEVLTGGPVAEALIQQALAFKRDWLESRKLVSRAFADLRMDQFFMALPEKLEMGQESECQLYVSALRCNGEAIAINVALKSGNRLLTHIASYDLSFEKFSPGSLLFEQSIAHSLNNDVAVFDLMSPGDAYKLDWTDTMTEVHDYAFGLTARGKAYETLYIRHLRPAMKQAALRLPKLVRPLTRLLHL